MSRTTYRPSPMCFADEAADEEEEWMQVDSPADSTSTAVETWAAFASPALTATPGIPRRSPRTPIRAERRLELKLGGEVHATHHTHVHVCTFESLREPAN